MGAELIPTLVVIAVIVIGFAFAILTAPNDLGRKKNNDPQAARAVFRCPDCGGTHKLSELRREQLRN